jgi:hypothetical protein
VGSVILRGMSLDELVAEAGRALGGARSLFGPAPVDGRWSSTQALSTGREAVGQAAQAAEASWSGTAAEGYGIVAGGRQWALDSTIGADDGTGPPVNGSGQAAADGGGAMDGVIGDARSATRNTSRPGRPSTPTSMNGCTSCGRSIPIGRRSKPGYGFMQYRCSLTTSPSTHRCASTTLPPRHSPWRPPCCMFQALPKTARHQSKQLILQRRCGLAAIFKLIQRAHQCHRSASLRTSKTGNGITSAMSSSWTRKATLYRRWPSKAELVVDAIGLLGDDLDDIQQAPAVSPATSCGARVRFAGGDDCHQPH